MTKQWDVISERFGLAYILDTGTAEQTENLSLAYLTFLLSPRTSQEIKDFLGTFTDCPKTRITALSLTLFHQNFRRGNKRLVDDSFYDQTQRPMLHWATDAGKEWLREREAGAR